MSTAARQGESVGPSFPPRPILFRIGLGCALLAGLLWLPAVHATGMYRCTGAGGETVFSSTTAGYAGCKRLGSYGAVPARVHRPAPGPKPALSHVRGSAETTARIVSPASGKAWFAGVQGSVQTTARVVDGKVGDAGGAADRSAGQWHYHESPTGAAAGTAAEASGDRVLRGAVYRVVRRDGSVEYTNVRPAGRGRAVTMLFSYIATCVACNLHSTIDWNSVRLNLTAYADTIHAASLEYGVNEAFLRAIIHAESAFNPHAMSLKGAQGLMQLMPATASDMGVLDAFDADQNIRGGARYLALLLKNFHGSERLAAAAYNAGPGAVQRYKGVPPYAETQVYVERVDTLRKRYGRATHPPLAAMKADASVRALGDL